MVLLVLFLFRLPLSITTTVYKSYQEGYIASAWTVLGSLTVLGAVAYTVRDAPVLSAVAGATQGWPVLALAFATILLLGRSRVHLRPRWSVVDRAVGKRLVRVGIHFTIAGIAGAILVGTDNIVIAQILGPEAVTPYAVTFLLTQVVITMVMLILDASWPAWSEAAGRGDVDWLRRSYRNVFRLTMGALFVVGGGLLLVGQPLIRWWAGAEAVPSTALLSALVLLSIVQGLFLCTGRLITALGAVHVTAGVGVANAVINLTVSIALGHYIGVAGVALGTVIGYVASGWVLFPIARRELARVEGEGT
jgi:O-antigen/teichoic acid export membrane protein